MMEKSLILSETDVSTCSLASDRAVASAIVVTRRFQLGALSVGMGVEGVLAAMSVKAMR